MDTQDKPETQIERIERRLDALEKAVDVYIEQCRRDREADSVKRMVNQDVSDRLNRLELPGA